MFLCKDTSHDGSHPLYGLLGLHLTQIKPNYEAMIKGGHLRITEMGIQQVTAAGSVKGRNSRKKTLGDHGAGPSKKGRGGDSGAIKLPAHGYPLEHPYNKDGYRYILAEPDPHAPFRQLTSTSSTSGGKRLVSSSPGIELSDKDTPGGSQACIVPMTPLPPSPIHSLRTLQRG
ncbi:unnamed protein product, partial [Timema podura]|nr:unnamed protein product [Timema podura]